MQKLSKRTIASRANGKLSRGPVTSAGKLRASSNSTRHGLLARTILVEGEDPETFALLHQQYIDRINPTDGIEITLVEDLAATVWRQRRLCCIETNLLTEAARKQVGPGDPIAGGFSELCRGPELALLARYETSLKRSFDRTMKNIQLLRQIERSADAEQVELANEPRSEQPPAESAACPTTSNTVSEAAGGTVDPPAISETSEADLNLPSTGSDSPQVPANPEIHRFPNEPRSEQPSVQSIVCPTTSKPEPDPYEGYQKIEWDRQTGRLRRIA
jgi:hypothetical protein